MSPFIVKITHLIAILLLFTSQAVSAQKQATAEAGKKDPQTDTTLVQGGDAGDKKQRQTRADSAYIPRHIDSISALSCNDTNAAGLGDEIQVVLSDSIPTAMGKLYLYINQDRMAEIACDPIACKTIHFLIARDPTKDSVWNYLYKNRLGKSSKKVRISIGNEKGPLTDEREFTLLLLRPLGLPIGILFFVFATIIIVLLGLKSSLLRDNNGLSGYAGSKPWVVSKDGPTFSLARTQLAFWTVLVTSCYVFIYAATGQIPFLLSSTLLLLGISMGSTAAARIVDVSQVKSPAGKTVTKTAGFIIDILSDDNGVSIHRFQIVLWDIILGCIFVCWTLAKLSFMDLSNLQLTLLGISSATYVGLKFGEDATKQTPTSGGDVTPSSVPATNEPVNSPTSSVRMAKLMPPKPGETTL